MFIDLDIIEFNIVPYLSIGSINNFLRTNKRLYQIYKSNPWIWRYLLERDFKLEGKEISGMPHEQYIYLNNKFKISKDDTFEADIIIRDNNNPIINQLSRYNINLKITIKSIKDPFLNCCIENNIKLNIDYNNQCKIDRQISKLLIYRQVDIPKYFSNYNKDKLKYNIDKYRNYIAESGNLFTSKEVKNAISVFMHHNYIDILKFYPDIPKQVLKISKSAKIFYKQEIHNMASCRICRIHKNDEYLLSEKELTYLLDNILL